MDALRKAGVALAGIVLFGYAGVYLLAAAWADSRCDPNDDAIIQICNHNPDVHRATVLGLSALVCLFGVVCSVFLLTRLRHWALSVLLAVAFGACFVHPTVWAVLGALGVAMALGAPYLEGREDALAAAAGRHAVDPHALGNAIADRLRRIPGADLRSVAAALAAGSLVAVGELELIWSGFVYPGVGYHRLLVGATTIGVAIAAALLALALLVIAIAAAALISRHPAGSRWPLVALLVLVVGLFLAQRWHSGVPNFAGAGAAIALATRCTTRGRLVARLAVVAVVAPLVTLAPGSKVVAPLLLVALAVPAADYAVGLWEYATETR